MPPLPAREPIRVAHLGAGSVLPQGASERSAPVQSTNVVRGDGAPTGAMRRFFQASLPGDGQEPPVDERTWNDLDMVASVGQWRGELTRWCRPDLRAGPARIEITEGVHPLLDDPVPNSLSVTRGLLVVVATHDLDLAGSLDEHYDRCFFADDFTRDDWRFDYRLQPGVATTRNAIRLLERLGYPPGDRRSRPADTAVDRPGVECSSFTPWRASSWSPSSNPSRTYGRAARQTPKPAGGSTSTGSPAGRPCRPGRLQPVQRQAFEPSFTRRRAGAACRSASRCRRRRRRTRFSGCSHGSAKARPRNPRRRS